MKIIRFSMSKGDPILMPFDKAQKVLDSDKQIIKVSDEDGNWTGQTLNKSFLVSTDIDIPASREKSKKLDRKLNNLFMAAPSERGTKSMAEILAEHKPEFLKEPN